MYLVRFRSNIKTIFPQKRSKLEFLLILLLNFYIVVASAQSKFHGTESKLEINAVDTIHFDDNINTILISNSLKKDSTSKFGKIDKLLGGQIGYTVLPTNQLDLGLNYYWSHVWETKRGCSYNGNYFPNFKCLRQRTFGPSISGLMEINHRIDFGMQLGLNLHFGKLVLPKRIFISYDQYFGNKSNKYIGITAGTSLLGLFMFGGVQLPLSPYSNPEGVKFKFGCRFVLNGASMGL